MFKIFFILCLVLFLLSPLCATGLKNVFYEMRESFNNVEDYKCILDDYQRKNDCTEHYVYSFYYKKKNFVRMDIIGGNKNIGTKLIHKHGRVRVKPGKGILSGFVFNFNPDNTLIRGLNGYRIHETTGEYFINRHIENTSNYIIKNAGEENHYGKKALVFNLYSKDPSLTFPIKQEKLWVDKCNKVLLKFILYDTKGQIIHKAEYKNMEINTGLKDEIFEKF